MSEEELNQIAERSAFEAGRQLGWKQAREALMTLVLESLTYLDGDKASTLYGAYQELADVVPTAE